MSENATPYQPERDQLAHDLRIVLDDAEGLLRHAVHDAGQGYEDARTRLERSLKAARTELRSAEQAVLDRARQAGRATDAYVHRHPWQSMGIGAGVGMLLGMLIARR